MFLDVKVFKKNCELISEYPSIRDGYLRLSNVFLLVYSIIDMSSFEEIEQHYNRILSVKDADQVSFVLIGNKCDLEEQRTVDVNLGKEFAKKHGGSFFETSAKTGKNIEAAFMELAKIEMEFNPRKEQAVRKKENKYRICLVM
jgi:small GTP-binding protein